MLIVTLLIIGIFYLVVPSTMFFLQSLSFFGFDNSLTKLPGNLI